MCCQRNWVNFSCKCSIHSNCSELEKYNFLNYHQSKVFSMPQWTSGSGCWIRGRRHIQSSNLFALYFNRTLVLTLGRGWVTCTTMCFGSGKQRAIGLLFGKPPCSSLTSASWSDSGPGLKLVVLVWAIFVIQHCMQVGSFGVALPPQCLAFKRNRCSGAT